MNKRFLLINCLACFSMAVQTPTLLFNSSCASFDVKSIDGSNWIGRVSGSFLSQDYIVDLESRTITYICGIGINAINLVIPNYVSYKNVRLKVLLGNDCFANCNGLIGYVELNDFITFIPKKCFYACQRLNGIICHRPPQVIGDMAFCNCQLFKKVVIKEAEHLNPNWTFELQLVGEFAFYKCMLSGNLIFSNNLKYLGEYSFCECFNVETIDLSRCHVITRIPDGFVAGCSSLSSVKISATTTNIGNSAFKDCTRLEYIDLPEDNMSLELGDYCFRGCSMLSEFSRTFTIISMGSGAFSFDESLNTDLWSKGFGVKKISSHAFSCCSSIGTIVFDPTAVTDVGDYAFASCDNLAVINFSFYPTDSPPNWSGKNIFAEPSNIGTVFVPPGATSSTDWQNFLSINGIKTIAEGGGWLVREVVPSIRYIEEPTNKTYETVEESRWDTRTTVIKNFVFDQTNDGIDLSKLTVSFPFDKSKHNNPEITFTVKKSENNILNSYDLFIKLVVMNVGWDEDDVLSAPLSFCYDGLRIPSMGSIFYLRISKNK